MEIWANVKSIIEEKVDKLDLDLFDGIPSQTSDGCRRSLLAVQRAVTRRFHDYAYLEIGSYLGGTIQPHLVDDRCKRIYSIDSRPALTPDNGAPGLLKSYSDNSIERMLYLLGNIGCGDMAKIECFDTDASQLDPAQIDCSVPLIAFVDGEHTIPAVLSDFQFCYKVIGKKGIVLFHDFGLIYRAIFRICHALGKQHRAYLAMLLGGRVFAIFFDPDLVHTDPYLDSLYRSRGVRLVNFLARKHLKRYLPSSLVNLLKWGKNLLWKRV